MESSLTVPVMSAAADGGATDGRTVDGWAEGDGEAG
jgi:hypothetical protein